MLQGMRRFQMPAKPLQKKYTSNIMSATKFIFSHPTIKHHNTHKIAAEHNPFVHKGNAIATASVNAPTSIAVRITFVFNLVLFHSHKRVSKFSPIMPATTPANTINSTSNHSNDLVTAPTLSM